MTAGNQTEFKAKASKDPRRLSVAAPKAKVNPLFFAKPIILTGWPLYRKIYIDFICRISAGRPVNVSYFTALSLKKWRSMTDWEKADFEAQVPPPARIDYVAVKREFPLNTRNATAQNEKAVRKMDLADKMAGLKM